MLRRLIALVGILALALAYLPAAEAGLSASTTPDCCNGIACPMHRMAHIECDMDGSHSGASFQSCPDVAQHYTVALTFVGSSPTIFFGEYVLSQAVTPVPQQALDSDLDTDPRPPRIALS